jgi:hypothetical protein
MRITIILLVVSAILLFLYFRKDIQRFLEEISLPDRNPELVSYLQGDWVVNNDPKSVFRIQRDSIFEFSNDTLRSASSLYYVFTGAASKYFMNDSAFAFSSAGKNSLGSFEFRLKEVHNNLIQPIWDTLIYVSRSRLDMLSHGKSVSFSRAK